MKTLQEKTLFLEQLRKTPIIQVTCEKTSISRATYYRWIRKDSRFKEQINIAKKHGILLMNDVAESKLLSQMNNGNMTAIIFWLKNNNAKYSDKKINLSKTEIKELTDSLISSDPEYALKLLTQKTIDGKIPRFLTNTLINIITKSIKINQSKQDAQKINLLSRFQ